jgi:lysophospholipase L1-like esterase
VQIDPVTHPEVFRGAAEWRTDGRWWQPWRLPAEAPELYFSPELFSRAAMPAGVRIALRSDAARAAIELDVWGDGAAHLDVEVAGELRPAIPLPEGATTVELDLEPGVDVVLWLPQSAPTRIGALRFTDATVVEPLSRGVRWATYGSSITHGRGPVPPAEIWPSRVARSLGWDLANLGMGANCLLDRCVIDALRVHRPDIVSMCIGINIYGPAGFNERTLRSQLVSFLGEAAAACPGAPFVLISPIASPEREDRPNAIGMTLAGLRELVEEVFHYFAERRDGRDVVVSGLEVLRLDEGAFLDDGLHPGVEGHRVMAERIADQLSSANRIR